MYPTIDPIEAQSWIFPTNLSVRKYQVDICRTALEHNTLVCLPTGLGKTLIAAVLVYNYYRFFPEGKIVFMAPTKPLVAQQFKACTDIIHLPEQDVVLLEGSTSPARREAKWKQGRVFFITPQTLANDLESGTVSPATARKFVLVVVDEAHRATDGYAYTHIVQHFTKCQNKLRVLALSATPGSDLRAVQNVIYNLNIARVEIRSESDLDIAQYTHLKQVELIKCSNVTTMDAKSRGRKYFHGDEEEDDDGPSGSELFDSFTSIKPRGRQQRPAPVNERGFSSQDATVMKHLTALMGPPTSYLASQGALLNDKPEGLSAFILQDAVRNAEQKLRDMFGAHCVSHVDSGRVQEKLEQENLLRARLGGAVELLTFLLNCKKTYGGTNAPALRIMLEDKQVEIQSILPSLAGMSGGSDGIVASAVRSTLHYLLFVSCCNPV